MLNQDKELAAQERAVGVAGFGVEKGLLDRQGRPLIARLIEDLAPQVDRLLINANRAHERYAAFGLPLIADDPRHAGLDPLARNLNMPADLAALGMTAGRTSEG